MEYEIGTLEKNAVETDADNPDEYEMELVVYGKSLNGVDSILNGTIRDEIGEMMVLDLGVDGIFNKEDYFLEASDNTLLGADGVIVYRKNGKPAQNSILEGVHVEYDELLNELRVSGLNLGEKEWVRFQYDINIKTEDPTYIGNYYYQTNGTTTLEPTVDANALYHFPIPSVKGSYITVEKVWDSGDNSIYQGVVLDIYRDNYYEEPYLSRVEIYKGEQSNSWPKIMYELAPYKENGDSFNYTAVERFLIKNDGTLGSPDQEGFIINVKYESKQQIMTVINTEYKGDYARLNVKKVDRFDEWKFLSGAEFVLMQMDASGNLFEVPGSSRVTGVGGAATFYIPNSGTFYLSEVNPPEGYQAATIPVGEIITGNKKFNYIDYTDPEELGIWTAEIDPNDHTMANMTVYNDPVLPLYIRRVDQNGNRIYDQETEFEFYNQFEQIGEEIFIDESMQPVLTVTTEDGTALADTKLYANTEYAVVDKYPPLGYLGLKNPLILQKISDGEFLHWELLLDPDQNAEILPIYDENHYITAYELIITYPQLEYPATGGPGGAVFVIAGILMMGVSSLIIIKTKK